MTTDVAGSAAVRRDGGAGGSLRFEGIVKWFGGVQSLAGVSLALHPGQVLALVGDNGAGKSTLVKILSGVHQPDAGQIWLDDEALSHLTPPRARSLGIETVHQDLALCDNLNAIANVVLGQEPIRFRLGPVAVLNKRQAVVLARQRLAGGRHPDRRLQRLRSPALGRPATGDRDRARDDARRQADDPRRADRGARRPPDAADARGGPLGRAARDRVMVISHSMEDVFAVADRIVVLRLGHIVFDTPTSETTPDAVVGHITGGIMGSRA